MEIVQIVLDKKLLHAADQAAKRTKRNRSALVRDALREHLRRLELRASEERDRQGYSRQSPADAEARGWESEATWPEEYPVERCGSISLPRPTKNGRPSCSPATAPSRIYPWSRL